MICRPRLYNPPSSNALISSESETLHDKLKLAHLVDVHKLNKAVLENVQFYRRMKVIPEPRRITLDEINTYVNGVEATVQAMYGIGTHH